MENVTLKPSSVAIRYGLIGGLISIIFSLITYFFGLQEAKWPQYIQYLILFVIVFLAIKYYKEEGLGGIMSFGQGFKGGALTTLVIALITLIWVYVYMQFIDPEFVEMIIDKNMAKMEERGMSDEQIEQALSYSRPFMTPVSMSIFAAIIYAFLGVIFSLIISAIMRKK